MHDLAVHTLHVHTLLLEMQIGKLLLLCVALIDPKEITADLLWKFNEAPKKEGAGTPTEDTAREEGTKKLVSVS